MSICKNITQFLLSKTHVKCCFIDTYRHSNYYLYHSVMESQHHAGLPLLALDYYLYYSVMELQLSSFLLNKLDNYCLCYAQTKSQSCTINCIMWGIA